MDYTPYISKLIALKCAAYVKTFETVKHLFFGALIYKFIQTHSKECKKQVQSIYSRKKRALKAANDMAKVQLKHRTREANANSDKQGFRYINLFHLEAQYILELRI